MKKRTIEITVIPRSSRNELIGDPTDDSFKVKLTAPPSEGAANEALVSFLSKELHVPKTNISIIRGKSGRKKIISIE